MPAPAALLSSDDLRRWRDCARHFWLERQAAQRQPGHATPSAEAGAASPTEPPAQDPRADADVVFGPAAAEALRAHFPGAVQIAPPRDEADWQRAVAQTAACLDHPDLFSEGVAIFGACLVSDDGVRVRIDVITGGARGLRLFKVRWATVADEADVDTVALWTHVAARCMLRLQGVGLLLVDTSFLYPGHGLYAGLLREVDLLPTLGSRPVAAWVVAMRQCERGPEPGATPGEHCGERGGCAWGGHCGHHPQRQAGATPLYARLEVLGRELGAELRAQGHQHLLSVPPERLSDARHRRMLHAVQHQQAVCEPALAASLNALAWPRRFLRLDTIGFAVPIWAGTRPYQVLPFQWTCLQQDAPGATLHTQHFLAEGRGDPRRALAEALLAALGEIGPVLAYNAGFERNRLRELALHFADLAPALELVQARIVDLFQLARSGWYHPGQNGSWSFKAMARVVAPELAEIPLGLAGQTSAQAAFAATLQRHTQPAQSQTLRAQLLAEGERQAQVLHRMAGCFAQNSGDALP